MKRYCVVLDKHESVIQPQLYALTKWQVILSIAVCLFFK